MNVESVMSAILFAIEREIETGPSALTILITRDLYDAICLRYVHNFLPPAAAKEMFGHTLRVIPDDGMEWYVAAAGGKLEVP